jgi:hypothetical protein
LAFLPARQILSWSSSSAFCAAIPIRTIRLVIEVDGPISTINCPINSRGLTLVGDVQQADDADHLRDLLQTEGGVILTTIEKFACGPARSIIPSCPRAATSS